MEPSDLSISRVGLDFGETFDVEQWSINAEISFGKDAVNSLMEKAKALLGPEEPNKSIAIVFTPAPGKAAELEEIIKQLIDGTNQSRFGIDISASVKAGIANYTVTQTGSKVIVHWKPGQKIETMMNELIEQFLGEVAEVADSEKATANLTLSSGVSFKEWAAFHQEGFSSLSILLKSLAFALTVKAKKGTLLVNKALDILGNMDPELATLASPFSFLLAGIDANLSFKSLDEVPEELRKTISLSNDTLNFFPRPPVKVTETDEFTTFKRFVDAIESGVDVYASIGKIVGVHASLKMSGFGDLCINPQPEDPEDS